MDYLLWDTHAMEGMLLNTFQQDKLKNNGNVFDAFFESLKFASTTPLFGHGSSSTQMGASNNVVVQL